MAISISLSNKFASKNVPQYLHPAITSDAGIKRVEWSVSPTIHFTITPDSRRIYFNASQDGVYTFTVKVTDNNGATATKSSTITVGGTAPAPTPTPTPTPVPPTGTLLYDSNTDIDWANVNNKVIKIGTPYGDPKKKNTKYIRMNASGDPQITFLSTTKELVLKHNGDYGRAYFGVINYACRIEIDFKLDSCGASLSLKSRNRHQYNEYLRSLGLPETSDQKKLQGGQGGSIDCSSTDADFEISHDLGEASGPSRSVSPQLVANKYYRQRFSQFDKDGKIHVIQELDRMDGQGFKIVNEGDVSPPSQCFNKADFADWSEFWVRYNTSGGQITFKNLKVYAL